MMTTDEGRLSRSGTHEKELYLLAEGPSNASSEANSAVEPRGVVLQSLRAEHPDLALMMECFSERLPLQAFDTIQEIILRVRTHACHPARAQRRARPHFSGAMLPSCRC